MATKEQIAAALRGQMEHKTFVPPNNPIGGALMRLPEILGRSSILTGIKDAITAPMDAYKGKLQPELTADEDGNVYMSNNAIDRAMNTAGAARTGGFAAGTLTKTPIGRGTLGATAWHGSPHLFDKFKNEAIGTGEVHAMNMPKYKNALEKARIEQNRSNAFDIDAEKKSISENGDADLSSIFSNPKLWDSENEEMTQAGLLAMDDIYTKKAIDNLRLPYIDDVASLDNANHRAQYEAMKSILDEKGIPYQDTSSAQSKYLEVGGKKIRFADHPNMVKDSAVRGSLPIINVSPTEYKFSDALSHVEGIERNGEPTGLKPWAEDANSLSNGNQQNLGIYGYK